MVFCCIHVNFVGLSIVSMNVVYMSMIIIFDAGEPFRWDLRILLAGVNLTF